MTHKNDGVDADIVLNTNGLIFDDEQNERPPWKVCEPIERSLIFCVAHFLILLLTIFLCLYFLAYNNFDKDASNQVWPVITFCIGCFIPLP